MYPSCESESIFVGSILTSNGRNIQLKYLGYKEMAGTYTCTVRGIGGQSSGNSTLEVYCKYYSRHTYANK